MYDEQNAKLSKRSETVAMDLLMFIEHHFLVNSSNVEDIYLMGF